uniref:Uncharacterized protein n=1 Tax=Oryza glumipatula TaxID=40148 RepID=A0A0E0A4T4_9ORYZ
MSTTVTRAHLEQRLALAKRCSREANLAGVKAAAVATIASAVPTLQGSKTFSFTVEGRKSPEKVQHEYKKPGTNSHRLGNIQ